MIGSVHCLFRFGPVGPLKNAFCSSPQRPSKAIHGYAASAADGSLGMVTTRGESSRCGSRVSSQPTPASAELPSQSAAPYLFACEPGARIDDRTRAVDDLELLVVPRRALGTLVGAVADLDRIATERRGRVGSVEDELDHLPVALVRVVEVVEGVEEPVLERHPVRVTRLGDDMRVHRRLAACRQPLRPADVVATRIERVAGEVEVVLEPVDEVVRRRRDLHEVGATPGPAERDRLLVEKEIDVGRDVRLAVAALVHLLDDSYDGCVALGERALVPEVGDGRRCCQRVRLRRRTATNQATRSIRAFSGCARTCKGDLTDRLP